MSESYRLRSGACLVSAIVLTAVAAQIPIAQTRTDGLDSRIRRAEAAAQRAEREARSLRSDLTREKEQSADRIKRLEAALSAAESKVRETETNLSARIDNIQAQNDDRFTATAASITRSYGITVAALVALASLIGGLYLVFRKRLQSQGITSEEKLSETRRSLEEQNIKLDEKLLTLLDRSLAKDTAVSDPDSSEPDHSLALKVADEIVRIEKNLAVIGPEVRGRKQLAASVERIRDNFAAKGYEIVPMLGRPYNEGMKVIANFRPDTTLGDGERIITNILKPQVNFGGIMIQTAQIEVSQG